jgi:hypothetical protein
MVSIALDVDVTLQSVKAVRVNELWGDIDVVRKAIDVGDARVRAVVSFRAQGVAHDRASHLFARRYEQVAKLGHEE